MNTQNITLQDFERVEDTVFPDLYYYEFVKDIGGYNVLIEPLYAGFAIRIYDNRSVDNTRKLRDFEQVQYIRIFQERNEGEDFLIKKCLKKINEFFQVWFFEQAQLESK